MTNFFIKNSNFYDALNDLDNGSIDVAIYPIENFPDDRKHNESKYIHEELLTLRPAIILNKNNSLAKKNGSEITFEDLRKQNMLLVDKDKILSVYAEICEVQDITGNILFENSDWETIRNFLKFSAAALSIRNSRLDCGAQKKTACMSKPPFIAVSLRK